MTGATLARERVVAMGAMAVAEGEEILVTQGLGSCVAVILLAPQERAAAMAHVVLPVPDGPAAAPARFARTAVPALVEALTARVGRPERLAGVLVGGATMFPELLRVRGLDVAGANLRAAETALADAAIPLRRSLVGGTVARSVRVDVQAQRVYVHTLRQGDEVL